MTFLGCGDVLCQRWFFRCNPSKCRLLFVLITMWTTQISAESPLIFMAYWKQGGTRLPSSKWDMGQTFLLLDLCPKWFCKMLITYWPSVVLCGQDSSLWLFKAVFSLYCETKISLKSELFHKRFFFFGGGGDARTAKSLVYPSEWKFPLIAAEFIHLLSTKY